MNVLKTHFRITIATLLNGGHPGCYSNEHQKVRAAINPTSILQTQESGPPIGSGLIAGTPKSCNLLTGN